MTANDSSSSAPSPPERPSRGPRLDLLAAGRLGGLAGAFLTGDHRDLLRPLTFLPPGEPAVKHLPARTEKAPDRAALAAGLAEANAAYGHPRVQELASRLADPKTRVVITGQQPGLLGGPLYTLTKAVAAARWAEALEKAGEPAVALFWVATEDHDWAEVARGAFPAPRELLSLDLGPDIQPLLPVGMRSLGEGVEAVLGRLGEAMHGERYAAWLEQLSRWYRPRARVGEAFSRLLVHLLGERSPLLLDAMLPAVKQAERPWLRRLVEERHAVDDALVAATGRVEAAGSRPQVSMTPGESPLFLLRGEERRRIVWQGGSHFTLRGDEEEAPRPVEELLEALESNPGVVSPGVLARPVVQDAILGTALFAVGPAEMAYMAQVAALYPVLGVQAPAITLRPQALVLDSRQKEHLEELGLGLGDLLEDSTHLDRALAARAGADFVTPAREKVAEVLDSLQGPTLQLDPSLEKPWEKTKDQVERALGNFGDRVASAAARADEVQRGRAEALREAVLPGGKPQERTLTTAHFPGKYGPRLVEAYFEQLDLDPTFLQAVIP